MSAVAPNYGTAPETLENNELAVAVTEPEKLQSTKRSYELLPALIISLGSIAAAALLYINSIGFLGDETQSQISFDIQEPTGNKPNFIFIVADDLSYNSIGYEPYDLAVSTPFLTKISDRGIRNLNYYGQEVCTPSRAALMTGCVKAHECLVMITEQDFKRLIVHLISSFISHRSISNTHWNAIPGR